MKYYLAIDIGASSGRHIVGYEENSTIQTQEIYRFANGVCKSNNHLTWDVQYLFNEVLTGIHKAFQYFPEIESLSIDSWGVDYVLLQGNQEHLPCYAYRDSRTEDVIDRVHQRMPFTELYRRTGCQFQPFNSIYQVYDDREKGRLEGVTDILMMPEYLMYRLTGVKIREYTNATTTGLISAETGQFDQEILSALDLPKELFPKVEQPGTVLGPLLQEIAEKVGGNCNVVLCATHDTASAVEGIPGLEMGMPYISSGTWSLLGVKTPKPITNSNSCQANYSNEGGVSYNRYQKNIMGMWLVNELQRVLCPEKPITEIIKMAEESSCVITVDANAKEFLAPKNMAKAFDQVAGHVFETMGDYFCCAYRSLATSYRTALDELEANTGQKSNVLYIVGGGAKNQFLNRLTEEASGKKVIALPMEATALGNLKQQMGVS